MAKKKQNKKSTGGGGLIKAVTGLAAGKINPAGASTTTSKSPLSKSSTKALKAFAKLVGGDQWNTLRQGQRHALKNLDFKEISGIKFNQLGDLGFNVEGLTKGEYTGFLKDARSSAKGGITKKEGNALAVNFASLLAGGASGPGPDVGTTKGVVSDVIAGLTKKADKIVPDFADPIVKAENANRDILLGGARGGVGGTKVPLSFLGSLSAGLRARQSRQRYSGVQSTVKTSQTGVRNYGQSLAKVSFG